MLSLCVCVCMCFTLCNIHSFVYNCLLITVYRCLLYCDQPSLHYEKELAWIPFSSIFYGQFFFNIHCVPAVQYILCCHYVRSRNCLSFLQYLEVCPVAIGGRKNKS